MSLTELFCHVDDFWQKFEPNWREEQLMSGQQQRARKGQLCESEIMTLLIHFHQARYRDFKTYYIHYVQRYLQREFPKLVSYNRFVQLIPRVIMPLYTCVTAMERVVGSALLTPLPLPSATIVASTNMRCLTGWQPEGEPRLTGSSASNCT